MTRLSKEQLNELMCKENVSRIWSYSRISCFLVSKYEYLLRYVKHEKYDRDDCIYGSLGGAAHQCLEDYYTGKIAYEDMAEQFEDSWVTCRDIAKLKFDRNDDEKDLSISKKYHYNLQHFFSHHVKLGGNPAMEKFVKIRVGNNLLQGYIDCIYKSDDGVYNIIDWKTSSEYKNKALEEHSAQLTLYAIGLMQMGLDISQIRIGFNFLKYCTVEATQKNGKKKLRSIERYKLGESLATNSRMWLKDAGYSEEEIDYYLKLLIDANDISVLPEEVQKKFVVSDRYVYIPLTQKLIDKWINIVTVTIRDIMAREKDYEETGSDKCFFDSEEDVKKESYYFSTLMGYSANLHKPYAEYLDKLEKQKNGIDLFGGIGKSSENNVATSQDICNNTKGSDDVDLSWLDEIE